MVPVTTVIDEFIFHCKYEKQLSKKTIEAYQIDLRQFLLLLKTNNNIENFLEIDRQLLKYFIRHLSQFKPKTAKRKIATIKAMFSFYEYENDEFINPFRKIRIQIKEPLQLPVVLSLPEIRKLFKIVYSIKAKISTTKSYTYQECLRDIAVLELLFATGLRVSELCSLKQQNIDLRLGIVKVVGKGNKERVIQICNKETINSLTEYCNSFQNKITKTGYFFVNRFNSVLSEQSVRNMIKKHCKLAKLDKHITPHTLRHTFATLLLEQDVDIKYIQHLLGHTSILTTQIYTHVNKEKQRKILSKKHPRHSFSIEKYLLSE